MRLSTNTGHAANAVRPLHPRSSRTESDTSHVHWTSCSVRRFLAAPCSTGITLGSPSGNDFERRLRSIRKPGYVDFRSVYALSAERYRTSLSITQSGYREASHTAGVDSQRERGPVGALAGHFPALVETPKPLGAAAKIPVRIIGGNHTARHAGSPQKEWRGYTESRTDGDYVYAVTP